jgi:hypothetical protein
MDAQYRIEPADGNFKVLDPWGEYLVELYPTEDTAKRDIELCKREDAMWETAKALVEEAIKAHMDTFGVDRDTARYWISSASDPTS